MKRNKCKTGNNDVHNDLFISLKRSLQAFQSNRIRSTYEDIRQDPEYEMLGEFFFNKLYAPEDFTLRNTSIKKLHKALDGKLYKGIIAGAAKVIELHEITDSLDNLMVDKMIEHGMGPGTTMEEYKQIYRSLDNYDQRIYQINLGAEVTRIFHSLSGKWVVGISLKTVKTAAVLFNIQPVIHFVYDGYKSFKKINNIDYFLDTVLEREITWHNEIWDS